MFLSQFPENVNDEFKISLLSLLINFKYDNASAIFHGLDKPMTNNEIFET